MTKPIPKYISHFVVYGALRSGTTVLRVMLKGHSHLICPGETDFLFDHLIMGADGPRYNPETLNRDRIYRAHNDQFKTDILDFTPGSFLDRITAPGKIGVLMQHRHLDRLLQIYPDMPIVHLLRDPRDVARSSIGMGWAGSTYYGVDHWIRTEDNWHEIAPKLSKGQALEIHYETLIREPEKTLTEICNFVGLSFEPAMLSYENNSSYSSPDPSLIEQWKRKQSEEELAHLEYKLEQRLERARYAPSGYVPRKPSPLKRLMLIVGNKRAVWRHRIKRFGWIDPFIVAIGRRLNTQTLARKAQQRIDEKSVRFLK